VILNSHAHLPRNSKKMSVCSKVFVECVICLGELEGLLLLRLLLLRRRQSLSRHLLPLIKPKGACITNFQHFDTFGLLKP